MSTRIKNLYTYLVGNRRPHVDGWLADYLFFTREVDSVRQSLDAGNKLRDKATYQNTGFAKSENPWQAFAQRLIYDKNNGISSRGQSVLSWDHFIRFIGEDDFVSALGGMIQTPGRDTFNAFAAAWDVCRKNHGAGRNPLLLNRALAACTMEVSSTVNGADFETVFWWLVGEKLLDQSASSEADWFDKNVHLMRYLRQEFAFELALPEGDPNHVSEALLSIFVWELSQNVANPFSLKKQVVKYGAPGTGKTHSAKQSSQLLFSIWREKFGEVIGLDFKQCSEVVQFHPSYGYEDFIEGLRPAPAAKGDWQLQLQNGIFKKFCLKAGLWEVEVHRIPEHGPELSKRWLNLTVGDLKPHVGKSLNGPIWEAIAKLGDHEKIADITPPFFFIIDEINRAELSRVLGELMICIEYRGVEGAISTQYAGLNTSDTSMLGTPGDFRFFIPHNVYLIGTMNTIDRSVESFDLALRRRFRWERVDPDIAALRYHLSQRDRRPGNASKPWVKLADNLESLNAAIRQSDLLGADYEIGHAYLMNLRYSDSLTRTEVRSRIWEDSIQPLLEEYLRGSGRAETLIPEFSKDFGMS